jgi:hypothetical protein
MINFKSHNFTKVIPLGEECYTCQSIDNKFNNNTIRKEAFPFDYVGHSFIKNILNKLINNNYLINNDLIIIGSDEKYFFCDNNYDFRYWHDIIKNNPNQFNNDDYNIFIEKYNRRYTRLYNVLNNNEKVLFISVCHFNDIYNNIDKKDDILNLYNFLMLKNNNFFILFINYTKDNIINNNFYSLYLNFDKNNNFNESKNNFTNILYDFINKNIIIKI